MAIAGQNENGVNTLLIVVVEVVVYGRSGIALGHEVSGLGSGASSHGGNDIALDSHRARHHKIEMQRTGWELTDSAHVLIRLSDL